MGSIKLRHWVLLVLIGVALVSSLWGVWPWSSGDWKGLALNFGTEMVGAVVTYLLLELVLGRREEEMNLIAQMGSSVKDVAIAAAEELRRHGWLTDGLLQGTILLGADLAGADLAGADLAGADLQRAILAGADLQGATLAVANLQGASLQGATLAVADLQGVSLRRADLQGARLAEANLQGAWLEGANLGGARYNDATNWPEDFTSPPEAINLDKKQD